MDMAILWIEFLVCSGAIVVCGYNLSRYGDVIAEKSGLGRTVIGFVLMAGVTSLPELINGISSVTVADAPDLALGDIMGSCIFNISIIALMDMLHGPGPIFSKADHGHIITAGFGIVLIGITAISILAGQGIPSIGSIGIYTPLIVLIYFIGIRSLIRFEHEKASALINKIEVKQYDDMPLNIAVLKYAVNALVIVFTATLLPLIGDRLAQDTGLGRSFFGTFFIGITTSLPELVVSISALRIGAADMAIANLFGSNIFNIFILAIDDIFYTKGPILSHVTTSHSITGLIAMVMTGIAIISLTYRLRKKTFLRLGWDAVAILIAYCVSILLLYSLK